MTETEKMAREMNDLFEAIGEEERLQIPSAGEYKSELEFLRRIKNQYTARLRRRMPLYWLVPVSAISDMFLLALRKREKELKARRRGIGAVRHEFG